jgi:quercetin dioxygenase-like cupin family protein
MKLLTHTPTAVDLTTTPVHLGLGSRARPIDGFAWDPEVLQAYGAAVEDDGAEGRMVMVFDDDASWTTWERHPAGDELVVCLAGRITVIRELEGRPDPIELEPGQAMVNPAGVWHTADLDGPVRILTITPGVGTEHRPRLSER